jgi:MFS transporter, ACS family, hexuronate transporter
MRLSRIRHLRWYVAALIVASAVINYIDRQTLSIVAPVLTRELHISQTEYAAIVQSFLIAYTIMYLFSGPLVDRWGTKLSMTVFVVWWSIANILHVFARSAVQLAAFRFLLGIGEPGNYNAAARMTSEWYPPRERAFVNGLVNAGGAIGAMIAPPLVAWLTLQYGWRFAFVATGALGFVWVIAWIFLYHLPEKHPLITPDELAHIRTAPESAPAMPAATWRQLWGQREVWGLLLARFFSDAVWWFYLFWMPKYLVEQRSFTLAEIGLVAWMPYLTADIGSVAGGWVSGWLVRPGAPILRARYIPMAVGAFAMPFSIAIAWVHSSTAAIALICMVTFFHMVWKAVLMTMTNDLYPTETVGSVAGIASLGSGLGGVLFMNLTGRIVEAFSYNTMFLIMGFLHPAAFLLCRWLVGTNPGRKTPHPDAAAAAKS